MLSVFGNQKFDYILQLQPNPRRQNLFNSFLQFDFLKHRPGQNGQTIKISKKKIENYFQ